MGRWCIPLVATLLASSLSARASSALIPLDEDGFHRLIAEHHGRVVLVDFWATWCAPCREELPKLVALHATYQAKGLDFVTISCDEPEQEAEAAGFVVRQGAPGPHYIRKAKDDDKFINSIDRKWSGALPALFVFDRSGRQIQSFIGESDLKQLDAVLKTLLMR